MSHASYPPATSNLDAWGLSLQLCADVLASHAAEPCPLCIPMTAVCMHRESAAQALRQLQPVLDELKERKAQDSR